MNAVFLRLPNGSETDISICTSCGAPARGRTNMDISQRCCTCWECGGPLTAEERKHPGHYHAACDRLRRGTIKLARMEKATLVENYDGPVYCEGVPGGSYGDGYFSDVDELEDCLEEGCGVEFAYCCTSSRVVAINLDTILENATEDAFEDAIDHIKGRGTLEAAVEAFNEANADVLSWNVDYSRKVKVERGS